MRPTHLLPIHLLPTLLLPLALALAGPAAAQESVVIYRCTDASGALTVQNDVPCPPGSTQKKTVMETVIPTLTPPAPTPAPELAAGQAEAPAEPVAAQTSPPATRAVDSGATAPATPGNDSAPPTALTDAQRLPPPVLYECRTWDQDRYLTEDSTARERCAPLQTTGLGGNPAVGAGVACQMTTDQCQRVPDGRLCEQWQQRLREVQAALRFGRADNRQAAQAEVERVGRIVRESTCGL